jgi:dihydroorotase
MQTLIKNVKIVNENKIFDGSILIKDDIIEDIFTEINPNISNENINIIDGEGNYIFPGIIDDQVHFRDPGLTYKGDIYTESRAAVAGGVTTFMDMPNVIPQSTTQELLEERYKMASDKSFANYSFYFGATNDNISEILKTDPKKVCGIKIFMGSSTGNMLVDKIEVLEEIFSKAPTLIATHCEDEETIIKNTAIYKEKFGENIPIKYHPEIRSEEACFKSSSFAVSLAKKYNTRLHVLHLTSAKEMQLFDNKTPAKDKKITAEVCVHHLWFNSDMYEEKGTRIKWNPAIKTENDRQGLLKAVLDNNIDVIATDHAPHTDEEKENTYFKAPSGGPMVQHSFVTILELYHKGIISLEKIAEKMCHTPADIFKIKYRGYIRKGYKADLTIVNLNKPWTVSKENILYKCGWSPLENQKFNSKVTHTFVNGNLVFNKDKINESIKGERLEFDR